MISPYAYQLDVRRNGELCAAVVQPNLEQALEQLYKRPVVNAEDYRLFAHFVDEPSQWISPDEDIRIKVTLDEQALLDEVRVTIEADTKAKQAYIARGGGIFSGQSWLCDIGEAALFEQLRKVRQYRWPAGAEERAQTIIRIEALLRDYRS